jgi:hypothetical protein
MYNLAIARTRVRLQGHIMLGVQTNTAINESVLLEGSQHSSALARHMVNPWTATSFLNIFLNSLAARNSKDLLPPAEDLFIRMFRVWDDCQNCQELATRNNISQRGALNFITADACASLVDMTPVAMRTNEETGPTTRQLNIIKVYEHRLTSIVWHPTERCLGCEEESSESWITNVHDGNPPLFLVLVFPDETAIHSGTGIAAVLTTQVQTIGGRRRRQTIKYQLLHVIQTNTGHYRDVGIEVQASTLAAFPISPWIMNDNMNDQHTGVQVSPPIAPVDATNFRPVLAVYYCTPLL